MAKEHYLSFCAIFRDEARYLAEWIEFHRLVGGERFFLYNNLSEDNFEDVLAPYVSSGMVEVQDWPDFAFDRIEKVAPGQCAAYVDCLERHREESRWLAFIDVDEFLFSPTLKPLPEVLEDYESFPGVVANRMTYGSSGFAEPPPGLVIENYTKRPTVHGDKAVKSVVDPTQALHCVGAGHPHAFVYRDGFAVNEDKRPIDRRPWGENEPVTFSRLRINHYWMRSEQDFRKKMLTPPPPSGELEEISDEQFQQLDARHSTEIDETMFAFVPALRRALERPAERV